METAITIYKGDLRTEATHILSGTTITTDAPPDNQGKGEFFSPTDLVATALGSCMLTLIGIASRTHGFSIDGTQIGVTKVMASNPRRIGEIHIEFHFPEIRYTDKEKKIIERAALTCPVELSLHPDIKRDIRFHYQD
jgi:putative redox protein